MVSNQSGDLFNREWPIEKMKDIKVKDALKHPIWSLGRKITVDSATLFNKVFFPSTFYMFFL